MTLGLSDSQIKTPRPLAKVKAGVGIEPFGALLSAATQSPSAAQALALAYAEFDRTQRQLLIDAVLADAGNQGINASTVLAPLLAIEQDIELARNIASAIAATGGAGLRCDESCRVLLAGDGIEGCALLARPLYGRFVELLGLCWNREQGIANTLFEPIATTADMQRVARGLPRAGSLEEIPVAYAVDVIAAALWHHRRLHGELPQVVTRFADLFERAV
jgi:hypothetical protein